MDLCGFCLVWLRPRFVLFRCFLCWRNANLAGRFTKSNRKAKPFTQTPGPKLARWEKRPTHATEEQPKSDPGTQRIPPKKTDDASLADQDKRYLLLQASYANMAKKPDPTNQVAEPSQASSPPSNAPVTAVAQPKPDTSEPVNRQPLPHQRAK